MRTLCSKQVCVRPPDRVRTWYVVYTATATAFASWPADRSTVGSHGEKRLRATQPTSVPPRSVVAVAQDHLHLASLRCDHCRETQGPDTSHRQARSMFGGGGGLVSGCAETHKTKKREDEKRVPNFAGRTTRSGFPFRQENAMYDQEESSRREWAALGREKGTRKKSIKKKNVGRKGRVCAWKFLCDLERQTAEQELRLIIYLRIQSVSFSFWLRGNHTKMLATDTETGLEMRPRQKKSHKAGRAGELFFSA